MAEQNEAERFDRVVDEVLANARASSPNSDAELAALAGVTSGLRGLPRPEFKKNLKMDLIRRASMSSKPVAAPETHAAQGGSRESQSIPTRYPTITPYLIVRDASAFIAFLTAAFGGMERFRATASQRQIMHAEVEVGNSVIELADANPKYPPAPQALHLYVPDAVDDVYSRAVAAGATPIFSPKDMEWGDRGGAVRDAFDNVWYVSMPRDWTPGPEGLRTIQPYLRVRGADWMITFLQEAFGAEAQGIAKSPEGKVLHATIRIGDWTLEVDDAYGERQPMPGHLHLHVPDADALYARAMAAGASSIEAPSDKPYGRSGGVRDPFGNSWFITTFPAPVASKQSQPNQQPGADEPRAVGERARITASPRLAFKDAAKAIEFYKHALGARETFRFEVGGRVPHAELEIGDSTIDVADEWPEGGRFSAETWGHSPVSFSIEVDDVDAFFERAVAAGMKVIRPIQDQFYGHREGTLADPFGYNWAVYTVKEEMSVEEMHRRMQGITTGPEGGQLPSEDQPKRVSPIPAGFRMLQPYIVAADGEALVEFAKRAFDAEEASRAVGSAGGLHASVRIGDTMLMMGGGIPGRAFSGKPYPIALHVYVKDTDATYAKALAAGGVSLGAPQDHEYGERGAGVKDPGGNFWYIATHKGESYVPKGLHNVNIYMHPLRAEPVINFVKRAFGAEEIAKYASPDGVVQHAEVRMGDTVLEMGEAHGPYQPMQSMFYVYVPDADAIYRTALAAGAKSIQEPKDQPYGDRNAGVTDPFGNTWYIATHIRDIEM
ncbi:MAG TPA: VOC family protein [Candidatus Acidoferrum sp.]|nr:VOC family protein [Candidatus Acidoferrum sp.]